MTIHGQRIIVRGTVQGVGFRPWVYRLARAEGLTGSVANDGTGVTIDAYGAPPALERFLVRLRRDPPPAASIDALAAAPLAGDAPPEFVIDASVAPGARRVSIPPDLATCEACAFEVRDPTDRRYRYPFTNCTDCGPRFTIARDVPYDRPRTSMAAFRMCPACQREYDDPASRRFHAQPNACPACGPRLALLATDGSAIDTDDPVGAAARALGEGLIVGVKGIGGFHLACDAASEAAVARLRRRKQRDEKPFAVMVRSLGEARALAEVGTVEARLLSGPERPIVLVPRRAGAPVAESVAPGTPLLGLLLPYSPLHHLLLGDAGRPLVMTSGNVSDEPIVSRNDEARHRLRDLADLLLVHDRDIVSRADDSVARVIAGAPVLLRRARGYVPRPVPLARPVGRPVFAAGGLLKNTFCLAAGGEAWLGPHIGDLDDVETFDAYREAVDRFERFLGIVPEVVAYDLHPEYPSTRYALARPEARKVGVQHHHAHVASLLAERGWEGPVIAAAYDGTGLGHDGHAWGGEILVADAAAFERVATFRPILLAGGDQAIRQPWRQALALLVDAYEGPPPLDGLRLFDGVKPRDLIVVREMLATGLRTVPAHGVGRYFDAVGALVLGRSRATYEGQVALELNAAADERESGWYPFDLRAGTPVEIDLRRGVRALVDDLLAGLSPARLAARFHRTIGAATAAAIDAVTRDRGALPVGLTGGCFQNPLLVADILGRLGDRRVLLHREVPPGDGGLALGQAVVADRMTREWRMTNGE
ncbi:MAG: carbamoyltransferase HypF [Acidobacteriota bacterium]